jgi:cellulose synthase/poly-beta-1,6-N-acetylglucosamine synthase-like glycosyltransferase
MGIALLAIYMLCMLCILAYGLAQTHLAVLYFRSKRNGILKPYLPPDLPHVTVQLPVYNEPLVLERLVRNVAAFDYPYHLLEIQVLDDSTDETVAIASSLVDKLKAAGIDADHVRRCSRDGYKAGALAHGLQRCKGEFIAVFDADFLPESDFLLQTIGYFNDAEIGAVQVRWDHLNRNYNLLTRLLAMTLDAHFTIEQRGRSAGENFINFNGTAGVWRRLCIEDAGGWSADTLTEDLDLSYRAQLKGWRIAYVEDYAAPAEIPMLMPAIRSQQYRWNKGGAEVARKLLLRVLFSDSPFHVKVHAVFHLLNTTMFICILISAVVSVPLLVWLAQGPLRLQFLILSMFLFSGFIMLSFFYGLSIRQRFQTTEAALGHFLLYFPMFLCMSMGLSLFNTIAVLEGFLGRKTPFVRTPKFASIGDNAQVGRVHWGMPPLIAMAEAAMAAYFLYAIVIAVRMEYYPFVLFHAFLATGFFLLFFYSVKHGRRGVASA